MKLKFGWIWLVPALLMAENKTDVSLFMKKSPGKQLPSCYSESGDLYKKLGHHGPAIENEFVAYRIFFDQKTAFDLYSKSQPRLEIAETKWYATPEQQKAGWGADHYHVGKTVGVGGVRLWDGDTIVPLNPVSGRSGRVVKEGTVSFLEVLSEGVPYKNTTVDVLIRLTVYSGVRQAKVEITALSHDDVQFVTGLNHRGEEEWISEKNYLLSWAPTGGKVAIGKIDVGAAVIFNPDDFEGRMDDETQELVISKPCKQLEYWISSANSEEPDVNTRRAFEALIDSFADE